MNNFRRDIKPEVIEVLNSRKTLYTSNIKGPNYYKPATRPSSFAKIEKQGLVVSTYVDEKTFDSVYKTGFKPNPVLQRLEVERVGQDASTVNLHLRIRAEFECFDYEDFLSFSEVFCKTDPTNKLTVRFGHINSPDGYNTVVTYTNVYIVYGMFRSTDQNSFICSFQAITGGEAVPSIDIMGLGSLRVGNSTLQYINDFAWWRGGDRLVDVTGIYELLLYDAQKKGQTLTSSYPDGQIISPSDINYGSFREQYFGKLNISNDGHIAVYKPVKGYSQFDTTERINKYFNIDPAGIKEQPYYSLEYITARILNQFGIRKFLDNYTKGPGLNGAAIGFPDEPHSYIPPGGSTALRSAEPYEMLICGQGAGKYVYANKGKDWDKQVEGRIHAFQGNVIDYRKILIHRDVIKTTFENSIVNHSQKSVSENPTANSNDDRILSIKTFCDNLFLLIKNHTGGQINLGLALDDEDPDNLIIRIIDLHYSKDRFNMWRFDVLTGDGNTQSLLHRSRRY